MATTFEQFSRNFSRNMSRAIERAIDRSLLQNTGEYIEDQIRNRTRAGFGVRRSEGNPYRLQSLATSTIQGRRRFRGLSSFTRPQTSNLTRTGLMLNSITTAVDTNPPRVLVDFANQEAEDRAEYVSPRRPFFNISRGDVTEITRRWNRAVTRQLANIAFNR